MCLSKSLERTKLYGCQISSCPFVLTTKFFHDVVLDIELRMCIDVKQLDRE